MKNRKAGDATGRELQRVRAVRAFFEEGLSIAHVCKRYRVSRTGFYEWRRADKSGGIRALRAKPRRSVRRRMLTSDEEGRLLSMIIHRVPYAIVNEAGERLPARLWSCRILEEFMKRIARHPMSRVTVLRYLKRWNLWPPLSQVLSREGQRPIHYGRYLFREREQWRFNKWTVHFHADSYHPPIRIMIPSDLPVSTRKRYTLLAGKLGRDERYFVVCQSASTPTVRQMFWVNLIYEKCGGYLDGQLAFPPPADEHGVVDVSYVYKAGRSRRRTSPS
jgi:transposase